MPSSFGGDKHELCFIVLSLSMFAVVQDLASLIPDCISEVAQIFDHGEQTSVVVGNQQINGV